MDERKLLLLIKNHPEIYNPQNKNYKKLEARNAAWKAIAQEMNEEESYCKKRWKNIRAVGSRDYIDPNKRSDYYLKEYLDFYVPFMKTGKLAEKMLKAEHDESGTNLRMELSEIEPSTAPKTENVDSFRPRRPYGSGSKIKYLKDEEPPSMQKEDSYTSYNRSPLKNTADQNINYDKTFLISIYEDFRTLDPRRKRIFKKKAMNLLNELHDSMLNEENSKGTQPKNIGFTIECGNLKWSTSQVIENS